MRIWLPHVWLRFIVAMREKTARGVWKGPDWTGPWEERRSGEQVSCILYLSTWLVLKIHKCQAEIALGFICVAFWWGHNWPSLDNTSPGRFLNEAHRVTNKSEVYSDWGEALAERSWCHSRRWKQQGGQVASSSAQAISCLVRDRRMDRFVCLSQYLVVLVHKDKTVFLMSLSVPYII